MEGLREDAPDCLLEREPAESSADESGSDHHADAAHDAYSPPAPAAEHDREFDETFSMASDFVKRLYKCAPRRT